MQGHVVHHNKPTAVVGRHTSKTCICCDPCPPCCRPAQTAAGGIAAPFITAVCVKSSQLGLPEPCICPSNSLVALSFVLNLKRPCIAISTQGRVKVPTMASGMFKSLVATAMVPQHMPWTICCFCRRNIGCSCATPHPNLRECQTWKPLQYHKRHMYIRRDSPQ